MSGRKLTESMVKALPYSEHGQLFIYDSALKGFGVRISKQTKSFIAERRLHGKTNRVTVGPHPQLTVEQARKLAHVELSDMIRGIDRKALERAAMQKAVSFGEVYKVFKQIRKSLSPNTIRDYDGLLTRFASDWLKRPCDCITPTAVLKRHAEIGATNGGPTANHLMRVVGSVTRFSMKYYKDANGNSYLRECPTGILSDTNAWFPERARDSYIKEHQIKAWWDAVQGLENRTAADYLALLLLTGLRRSEAACLRFDDIDFDSRTITIPRTKNGKKHVLPMTAYLLALLERRRKTITGDYVFPGPGVTGHIVEIKKAVARVQRISKVTFTLHDLRRTFVTVAESLDISSYAVKKLINHSTGGDVTAQHYIVFDIERLRDPMERINRFMLRHAGALPTAEVVQLPSQSDQVAA